MKKKETNICFMEPQRPINKNSLRYYLSFFCNFLSQNVPHFIASSFYASLQKICDLREREEKSLIFFNWLQKMSQFPFLHFTNLKEENVKQYSTIGYVFCKQKCKKNKNTKIQIITLFLWQSPTHCSKYFHLFSKFCKK